MTNDVSGSDGWEMSWYSAEEIYSTDSLIGYMHNQPVEERNRKDVSCLWCKQKKWHYGSMSKRSVLHLSGVSVPAAWMSLQLTERGKGIAGEGTHQRHSSVQDHKLGQFS